MMDKELIIAVIVIGIGMAAVVGYLVRAAFAQTPRIPFLTHFKPVKDPATTNGLIYVLERHLDGLQQLDSLPEGTPIRDRAGIYTTIDAAYKADLAAEMAQVSGWIADLGS